MIIKISNRRLRAAQAARAAQVDLYRSVWGDTSQALVRLTGDDTGEGNSEATKLLHMFLSVPPPK